MTALDHAITFEPDHAAAHTYRALTLTALGRYVEARAACERTLAIDDEEAEAHDALGLLLLRQGDPEGALKELDRALRLDNQLVSAWRHKAEILRALGNENDAIAAARQANTLEAEQQRIEPDGQPAVRQ